MGRVQDARATAARALAKITGVDVHDYPRAVDQPVRPFLVLAPTRVVPADVACPTTRVQLDVWVVTQHTDHGTAADPLDALLDQVLDALDAAQVRWTDAEPVIYRDTHAAYRVAVEVL